MVPHSQHRFEHPFEKLFIPGLEERCIDQRSAVLEKGRKICTTHDPCGGAQRIAVLSE